MPATAGSSVPGGDLSPDVLGMLSLLELGGGALLLVSGGNAATRRSHLRAIEGTFRARGIRTERLVASSRDREVPYGALLPWLSRWVGERSTVGESRAARAPQTTGRASPERREAPLPMVALVGLFAPGGAASAPTSLAAAPSVSSLGHDAARPAVEPEDVRLELLELVSGAAKAQPTFVALEHAELLDPQSREWLHRLVLVIERVPLLLAFTFDHEGPELTEWSEAGGHPRSAPLWHRLPPPPPETHQPSVQGLPLESRRLLLATLLSGNDADPSLIAEALSLTEGVVRQQLDSLRSKGWLDEHDGTWSPVEPALVEEGLVELGASASPEIHRGIARGLERRFPQAHGINRLHLADHWTAAGALEKAVPLLREGASECEVWGAPELATLRLQRALLLAQREPGARGRELEEAVLSQLGSVRYRAEDPVGTVTALRKALELSQARGTSVRVWGSYVARLANARVRLGEDPEPELRTTLEKVRGLHPGVEAILLRALASYLLARGRPEEAIEAAEKAASLAEKGNDVVLAARTRITAATCYLFGGRDLERPRQHLLRVLEMREKIEGDPEETVLVDAYDQLALIELNRGNFAEANRMGEEALQEARRRGSRTSLVGTLGNSAEYACAAGNWKRAEEMAIEMRRLCERYSTPETDDSSFQLLLVESMISGAKGEVRPAMRKLDQLIATAEKSGIRYFAGQAVLQQALLLERSGDLAGARRLVRRLHHEGMVKSLGTGNVHQLEALEKKLSER
ncbi:MAG: hypothetical protein KGJ69_10990 [Thermoplasmata archaeon]|nr:hypothetical protein [Thermoplasmata archaeon]